MIAQARERTNVPRNPGTAGILCDKCLSRSIRMSEHEPTSPRLVRGYRRILDHARELLESDRPYSLREAIDHARERVVEIGEVTREEAEQIGEYVRRDLHDAGDYLSRTGRELRDWAQIDLQLVEQSLFDLFARAADRTRLEIEAFNRELQAGPPYRTGEMTGPGSLRCENCGQLMHFHQPGHIPPCPSCRHTLFRRFTGEES